jgi:hypothetical protein
MGSFDFSNLEDRSIKDNFTSLKREFEVMQRFLQEIDRKWTDQRKNEFSGKYINNTITCAEKYIKAYEELVQTIDRIKKTDPKFYNNGY